MGALKALGRGLAMPAAFAPTMSDLHPTDAIQRQLPSAIATSYGSCLASELRPLAALRGEVDRYLVALRERRGADPFLDLATAEKVGAGCMRLIELLERGGSKAAHHAVQAAVTYFELEEDAEADESVIGFDDDLKVVEVTFSALGWSDGGVLS